MIPRIKKLVILSLGILSLSPVVAQNLMTLEDALSVAGVQSPDLRSSLLDVERTRELLNAKRAALKSNFSLNLNPVDYSQSRLFDDFANQWYTQEKFRTNGTFSISQPLKWTDGTISMNNQFGWQDNYSTNSNQNNKTFSNNLYLNLNQPLFTYNRTKMELEQVELDHENAMLENAMLRLNLEKNVSQFFYNVYLDQMSVNISEESYTNNQKSYDIIKRKVEAGLAAKEEMYQAEIDLANARSDFETKKVNLENTKDQFKQYLGIDLNELIGVMANVENTDVVIDLQKAVEFGLKSRMEIRQREIDITNSQFSLIEVKANNEFKGDVNLSVGLIGEDEDLGNIYDNPTQNPAVKVSFNVPLWDWGERKARIRAQEATMQKQEINLEQQKVDIQLDIRKVYRNIQNLINQIDIARQSEKNAELTYEINLEKYRNGDLTSMDLSLIQTQLAEKKMALAEAQINYKIELLNMKIQSMYDFERNTAIVPEEFFQEYQEKVKN